MASLIETLRSGRVLLMDGAMGTELQRAGIGENECYEAWNVKRPDAVNAIHCVYRGAGAECLLTNTFQLIRAGHQGGVAFLEKGERLADAALALARTACHEEGFVLATLGPSLESDSFENLVNKKPLVMLIRRLGRADGLLLETCSSTHVMNAVLFIEDVIAYEISLYPRPAVLLSLSFRRNTEGRITTVSDEPPERFASFQSIDALGTNCGRDIGMTETIEIIRRYRQETDLPLFARPNAGTPKRVGDRWVYPLTPEKMAERLPELLEAGVSMIGGCCGTTPEHIAAMRPIVDAWNAKRGFALIRG